MCALIFPGTATSHMAPTARVVVFGAVLAALPPASHSFHATGSTGGLRAASPRMSVDTVTRKEDRRSSSAAAAATRARAPVPTAAAAAAAAAVAAVMSIRKRWGLDVVKEDRVAGLGLDIAAACT